MKIIYFQITLSSLISFILLIILNFLSKKTFYDREKNSPFECGFDPKNLARLPFSLHFFLIAIIFIIFDIELTLLLPSIIALKSSNYLSISYSMVIFTMILLFGLYHENNQGSLNWTS
uniref:NADH dehydrogenase subunit 3 n=1 Tax=Hylurgus ligniperda TaxID=167147 RepID=UPI00279B09F0|nr:NADH dehydrogenase subunit 3 [Hylurgus ligniperda]WGL40350.1 NADH dehydrogenase subunit 3 [Hylurgus ligniperda]WKD83317.1 NADH dehydrogenase subunit 3 [Hylurgus ligniperda]